MPRGTNEAAYPKNNSVSRRSHNVKTPIVALARLASGMDADAWKYRKKACEDAAGLRAHRWKEVTEVMLAPWFHILNGHRLPPKCNIAEWLCKKHETLSTALARGEILQVDVLDAVVHTLSAPLGCSASTHTPLNTLSQVQIDIRILEKLYVCVLARLKKPS